MEMLVDLVWAPGFWFPPFLPIFYMHWTSDFPAKESLLEVLGGSNSVEGCGTTAQRLPSHFENAWASLPERRKPPCHHHCQYCLTKLSSLHCQYCLAKTSSYWAHMVWTVEEQSWLTAHNSLRQWCSALQGSASYSLQGEAEYHHNTLPTSTHEEKKLANLEATQVQNSVKWLPEQSRV